MKSFLHDIFLGIWEMRYIIYVFLWIEGAVAFFSIGMVSGYVYTASTAVLVYFGNSYREKHNQYPYDGSLSSERMEKAKEEFIKTWKENLVED